MTWLKLQAPFWLARPSFTTSRLAINSDRSAFIHNASLHGKSAALAGNARSPVAQNANVALVNMLIPVQSMVTPSKLQSRQNKVLPIVVAAITARAIHIKSAEIGRIKTNREINRITSRI